MSAKTHDLAVYILRAQPYHMGHHTVIREALNRAHYVLVLIGSTGAPRSHRNPFDFREREQMIRNSFTEAENGRIQIRPLEDSTYNEENWIKNVQAEVNCALHVFSLNTHQPYIALIGHNKDHTSYYLNMFPQWDSINVECYRGLSSTPMREAYFSNIGHMWLKDCDGHKEGDLVQDHLVTPAVKQFLEEFINTKEYKDIRDEYEFVSTYKSQWVSAPYPPIFVTVDAVVVQSGHVLLVRRGGRPGLGQLALPGGFLNQNETILDGVIRELREETKIKVPEAVLRGSIVANRVFDDPNRSARGRTITHAFLIHLKGGKLPPIKGSDDATHAMWVPLSQVKKSEMFEDHFHVIQNLVAQL